jgi:tellurite resistance protein TerB
MGFFSSLKSGLSSLNDQFQGEVTKFQNRNEVNATLAIVALVAGADGDCEPEEKKAGVDLVRSGNLFKAFAGERESLASTLDSYYNKCTNDILKDDLYDEIRKVASNKEAAARVVRVGLAISKSDGVMEKEEVEVLREVCSVLGLDPKGFKGLS